MSTASVRVSVLTPNGCASYYTWDGTDPTTSSARYTEPLYLMPGTYTLSVINVSSKGKVSPVARYTYTLYIL